MTISTLWMMGWVLVPHTGTDLPPSELGVPCRGPFGGLNQPGGVHRSPVRIRTRREHPGIAGMGWIPTVSVSRLCRGGCPSWAVLVGADRGYPSGSGPVTVVSEHLGCRRRRDAHRSTRERTRWAWRSRAGPGDADAGRRWSSQTKSGNEIPYPESTDSCSENQS